MFSISFTANGLGQEVKKGGRDRRKIASASPTGIPSISLSKGSFEDNSSLASILAKLPVEYLVD